METNGLTRVRTGGRVEHGVLEQRGTVRVAVQDQGQLRASRGGTLEVVEGFAFELVSHAREVVAPSPGAARGERVSQRVKIRSSCSGS